MNPIAAIRSTVRYSLLVLCTVIATPLSAADDQARHFDQGRAQVSITAGTGYAFDEDYLVIGAGLTYFLSNGLGIGLSVESWTSGDPGLTKVEPSLQYVFVQSGAVKPYVGAFFNQTFIEGLEDLQSVGARGGVYISAGPRAFIGAGAAYESYLDCKETIFRSCDDVYPEFSFVIGF
jgi:hypothetical protein